MASEPKPCGECKVSWDEKFQDYYYSPCPRHSEAHIVELKRQLAAERERVIEECAKVAIGWACDKPTCEVGSHEEARRIAAAIRRLAEKPAERGE